MPVPPDAQTVLAFDIGGANLKAADGRGHAHAEPFPLWRQPQRLAPRLAELIAERRPARVVATMTGEIADCYASRAEGVAAIVAAVVAAARPVAAPVAFLATSGALLSPAEARAAPLTVAAANWHALARLATAHAPAFPALAIDVGSTTTDITPLLSTGPMPRAVDDVGRLRSGELVYTGVERTPVAALVRRVDRAGVRCPVVAERYAESRDAWLLLGELAADPLDTDTADGRPFTPDWSRARLARMLLEDPETFSMADAVALAEHCATAQARDVARALRRVAAALPGPAAAVVLSGHGACLARRALGRVGWRVPVVSLAERLSPAVARVAPAHALALVALGELR